MIGCVVVVAAVAVGCGRTGTITTDAPVAAAAATPAVERQTVVYALGDSNLPEGLSGDAHTVNIAFPTGPTMDPWTVVRDVFFNTGLTSADAATMIDLFGGAVARTAPNLIFVEIGTVDCFTWRDRAYDPAADSFGATLTALLDGFAANAPGVPILWVDAPAIPYLSGGAATCRTAHNDLLAAQAAARPGLTVLSSDRLFDTVFGAAGQPACLGLGTGGAFLDPWPQTMAATATSRCVATDGIHFTPETARVLNLIYVITIWLAQNNGGTPCPSDAVIDYLADLVDGVDAFPPAIATPCPVVD